MNWAKPAMLAAVVLTAGVAAAQSAGSAVQPSAIGASGKLVVPPNYRDTFQYLGSWSIAADQGRGAKEMHSVYASPGAIAAYRAAGRFPNGTVLVKEVFGTATGPMTTGTVSHADVLKG